MIKDEQQERCGLVLQQDDQLTLGDVKHSNAYH